MKSLPSAYLEPTTHTGGIFRIPADRLAEWLCQKLSVDAYPGTAQIRWAAKSLSDSSLIDMIKRLPPLMRGGICRYLLFQIGTWTYMLNNAFLGTDVGIIPSRVARDLGSSAIRATCVDDTPDAYGAVILEVYEPNISSPHSCRRIISAANDGGKWRFHQYGEPFEFENLEAYQRRRIQSRFTADMLRQYLTNLHVPGVQAFDADKPKSAYLLEKT